MPYFLGTFGIILTIIFTILKITNIIFWSWLLILSPILILAILGLSCFAFSLLCVYLYSIYMGK